VHIVFHAHHADVTEPLQQRAEAAVRKLATRLRGTTDASIRFGQHGTSRRVEIMLRVVRRKPLVAEGEGTRYETALAAAVERLSAHVAHLRAERSRNRHAPVGRRADGTAGVETTTEPEDDVGELLLEAPPPRRTSAGA